VCVSRHHLQGVTLLGVHGINKLPPATGPDPDMGMLLAFGGYNGGWMFAAGRDGGHMMQQRALLQAVMMAGKVMLGSRCRWECCRM